MRSSRNYCATPQLSCGDGSRRRRDDAPHSCTGKNFLLVLRCFRSASRPEPTLPAVPPCHHNRGEWRWRSGGRRVTQLLQFQINSELPVCHLAEGHQFS
jgi:hypothetical protein